ncbi:MAG: hypothetical protein WDN06_14565 [Asticcacaulis sp.]
MRPAAAGSGRVSSPFSRATIWAAAAPSTLAEVCTGLAAREALAVAGRQRGLQIGGAVRPVPRAQPG